MRYLVIDMNNLVNRATHVIKAPMDDFTWVGSAMEIVFNSIARHFDRFSADHVVACFDSWSWREKITDTYKANRKIDPAQQPKRFKTKQITKEALQLIQDFLSEASNVSVLRADGVEADDFAARWIQLHPDDHTVAVTNDGDFKQLVCKHADIYDPFHGRLYTVDGTLYQDDKPTDWKPTIQRFGKTWKHLLDVNDTPVMFDAEWELFYKCLRGDPRDNIRPAYPRVSETRMRAAYADRGGVAWNNLLNAHWGNDTDRHSVRELYESNRALIDLTLQPEEIITVMDWTILDQASKATKRMVDVQFDDFCHNRNLTKLLEPEARPSVIKMLIAPYMGNHGPDIS